MKKLMNYQNVFNDFLGACIKHGVAPDPFLLIVTLPCREKFKSGYCPLALLFPIFMQICFYANDH